MKVHRSYRYNKYSQNPSILETILYHVQQKFFTDKAIVSNASSGGKTCEEAKDIGIKQKARMKFALKPEMNLDEFQQKIAYYVFEEQLEESEILFNCDGMVLNRKDFECFLPGNEIPELIVLLMCWLNTLRQTKEPKIKTWTLPLAFAAEVIDKRSVCDIIDRYCLHWMPHTRDLQYVNFIFVPVLENHAHWYLVVVSFLDQKLDEDVARMSGVLKLLLSPINELEATITARAEEATSKFRARKCPN
ncbi:hypothetical protein RIF29_08923 [Crotalaria pallida]|uniref:Ubiquitin-like protease family profile domain-containing protein n=1 Tax=Crotalaria pallida TaxID=3830 RepID=A0AAN9FRA5_CROPI